MLRNTLPQEEFLQKILVLDKDAKVSVRPFDASKEMNEHSIKIGDFRVDWYPDNAKQPPTINQINSVTQEQLDAKLEFDRKLNRENLAKKELGLMASFMAERKNNPSLLLSEYLDQLENFISKFENI